MERKDDQNKLHSSGRGTQGNSPNTTKVMLELHLSIVIQLSVLKPKLESDCNTNRYFRNSSLPHDNSQDAQWPSRDATQVFSRYYLFFQSPWRRKDTSTACIPLSGSSPSLLVLCGHIACRKRAGEHWNIGTFPSFADQCPAHVSELEFSSHVFRVCCLWLYIFQASLGVLLAEAALHHLGSTHLLVGFVLPCEKCNSP